MRTDIGLLERARRWFRRTDQTTAEVPPAFDHEHPCPSSGCVDDWRRRGYDVPDDMDCCICWFRQRWEGKL